MNQAPQEIDHERAVFAETLGQSPGKGRLAGRRIIVVGAGQRPSPPDETTPVGNGRAISEIFALEGATVACLDAAPEAAQATVDAIAARGNQAFAKTIDVRESDAIAPMVAQCAEQLGGLDGLVMNVGISQARPLNKITVQSWDDEFSVNLRSHMLFAQAALPLMDTGGSMVLISSLAGLRNGSGNPTYEATKAAQISLARALAVAGEPRAIRCNAVLPGLMDTPMGRDASRRRASRAASVPFGRQGTGWEVAYACLYLISHESSYVNGHALLSDGGLHAGVVRRTEN
ncbi:MAG: SDR family NAD(P)-dependent oxidoreductase [Burkholderiaceae bacterium]